MPLPEYSGVLGVKRAAHLLRRATFGPTLNQIKSFSSLTPQAATGVLFKALPDPVLPPDPKTGQPWFSVPPAEDDEDDVLQGYFKGWFIAQMMSAGITDPNLSLAYSAREKIVFFLHTHFTTIQSKVSNSRSLYFQNQLFRKFAFDSLPGTLPTVNFKALSVKICVDNAMLRLLDGDLNVKGSPNENYAREFFELYTIGRGLEESLAGVPAGPGDYILFTETDVQAAAKVLSGWELVPDDAATPVLDAETGLRRGRVRGSVNNASGHDNTPKQFSARFNNAVIQGNASLMNGGNATEASALDEIRQLVDLIYSKTETAHNICWKIYRFFVYAPHTPAESKVLDNTIISEMVNTLIANNYKIQPVIENLLRSTHFYETNDTDVKNDNFGGLIKSPLDLVVGTLRLFQIQLPDMLTSTADFYKATDRIISDIENLGMNFYDPYDVAGYEAYHQFPIYHRSWITPNYLARRYDFIRALFMTPRQGLFAVDGYQFVKNNPMLSSVASDSRALIIELANYLLPATDNLSFTDPPPSPAPTITAKRMNYFRERLLQQFDEAYWASRWSPPAADLDLQLAFLFNAMLQSPEYQLA
jgi:uncharacterized protein (DUF1800 family)